MKKLAKKEPFETQIMRSLFRAQILLCTMSDALFVNEKKLTISFSQFLVLRAIESAHAEGEEASQITLARALSISAPAISRHIDNLLMLGYVVCHINQKNKKQHLLELTKKGEKTVREASELLVDASKNIFASITATERKKLIENLNMIIMNCNNKQ